MSDDVQIGEVDSYVLEYDEPMMKVGEFVGITTQTGRTYVGVCASVNTYCGIYRYGISLGSIQPKKFLPFGEKA